MEVGVAARAVCRVFEIREEISRELNFPTFGIFFRFNVGFGQHQKVVLWLMTLLAFEFGVRPFQWITRALVIKLRSVFEIRGCMALRAVLRRKPVGKLLGVDIRVAVDTEF